MKHVALLFMAGFTAFALCVGPVFQSAHAQSLASDSSSGDGSVGLADIGRTSIYTDYMAGDMNEDEHKDGYIKPSYERLSQLYWALGMFDLDDNVAIDGYLQLQECDLYKQFFTRDFELSELRKVTRESIRHNISMFPTKFEIFMPIGLERYDIPSEKFKVSNKSLLLNAKRLEVSRNTYVKRVCGISEGIPKYPRNFILQFNRPFTLAEVSMSPKLAQDVISFAEEDVKKGVKGKYFEFKDYSPFQRFVFLRLKVTMSQFKEMGRNYSDETVPIIFATIDGYQLFFDQERTLLIYDQEIESTRKFERLKDGVKTRIEVPDGPLLEQSKPPEKAP